MISSLARVLACVVVAGAVRADDTGRLTLDDATRGRCLTVLRAGLASDEFWPSMHAAEGLSLAGLGAEVRAAIEPRLQTDHDAQHRCGLARELVRAGDLARTRLLLEILASPDPHGHVHACESLFKVWQVGDGALLRQKLAESTQPRLGIMAAAALARWGNRVALARLREYVGHADGDLASVAAWVLGRVGDASDLPALRDGARRFDDPLTRAYFEHAMAALGAPEGLAALARNLRDGDARVRVQAAEFAADARAMAARDGLIALLDDPVLDVRIRAAQALLQLAQPAPPSPREDVIRDIFPANDKNPRYSEGSVIVLRDGRLLDVTTEFEASTSDFARARLVGILSSDGGRTWGERKVLQENVGKTNVMSVTLRRLRPDAVFDGPIGMFYLVKNSPTDLDVYLRVSDDEGATFGEPRLVTDRKGYHVLNNDRVTVLSTGRILVPVASTDDVSHGGRFASSCWISDDQGKTWRAGKGSVGYPQRGAMEPEVLESAGGRLLMHIRTQLGHVALSESVDGGESWSNARAWTLRAPEAPATLRRIPSTGHLLMIWNDTFRPGAGHGGKRTPLTAVISTDEGKTWVQARNLEARDDETYAYTSIAFDRGRVLLTYYVENDKTGRLSTRFRSLPIAWLHESNPAR